MRLAFGLGRTVRELEGSMGADEWADWLAFHAAYDLPDGFLVAGQLGALVSQVAGGKGKPAHFAPYYAADPAPGKSPGLGPAFAFLRATCPQKATTSGS